MAVQKKGKRAARKKAQSKQEKLNVMDIGHKVWLAGLGALARAQSDGPKLFEALVADGAKLHARALETTQRTVQSAVGELRGAVDDRMEDVRGLIDARMEEVRDRASETWDNIEKIFETRVQAALKQLGVPTANEIRSLSRKVEDLTKSVNRLAPTKREARSATRKQAELHA